MSYIRFDRRLMSHLEESLQREYIRTNRMGAYCCTSIVGCNTRKYHGVLVVPIPELSPNNHVLLSTLDLSIVQHGVPFNIGVHEYQGDVFSPKGYKYIREYNIDTSSSTTYRVGGVVLQREFYFCHYEHRAIIRFTLLEAHSETKLRLSPFLAFRDVKMLTHRNTHANTSYEQLPSGIAMSLYDGYPSLYMQHTGDGIFVPQGAWNENIIYFKERERGYEHTEDLYVPGYFEIPIQVGESIYFSAGLKEVDVTTLATTFEHESYVRIPRTDFRSCLLNAAQQFYYRPTQDEGYLLAGYPWFGVRARDLFVSLPGCSIYADAPERFYRVMDTAIPAVENFINQVEVARDIRNINEPDVGVWAIWAIQQYASKYGVGDAAKRYGSFVSKVVAYYRKNVHPQMYLDDNGLLYIHGDGRPLTWMDAKLDGRAVVQREGYTVELNALWFNALCFYQELLPEAWTDELERLRDKVRISYVSTFVNQYGYLFDQVQYQGEKDWSVRPNMIFAVSLAYTPLSKVQQRSVLEIVTRELRTPKGLRSLSPNSFGYKPQCNGSQRERELSYYNGSAWPWLFGAYLEAYLKLNGRAGISFVERTLIGMQEEIKEHGLGTISELFDGNPPYRGRGAISFAMSVGEILRSLALLEQAKTKYKNTNSIISYK